MKRFVIGFLNYNYEEEIKFLTPLYKFFKMFN